VIPRVKVCSAAQPHLSSDEVCPPLSGQLSDLGFALEEDIRKSEYLVSFDHNQAQYDAFKRFGGVKENAVLIRLEPQAVYPAQHREMIENLYGFILTPGSLPHNGALMIPWPYYYNQNPLKPQRNTLELKILVYEALENGIFNFSEWADRPLTLSLIASNKVSSIRANNYRLRRRIAYALPREKLSVYGGLWNSSILSRFKHRAGVFSFSIRSRVFPNLLEIYGNFFRKYVTTVGIIPDKHEVIRKSKFSLVIENDNNYVSEKLIDTFLGGSIPIYFGGNFEATGIPPELVFSSFSNPQEILDFIDKFSEKAVREYQGNVVKWLQSDSFLMLWDGDRVFATIADEIARHFRKAV
jgi:hypothetical protein